MFTYRVNTMQGPIEVPRMLNREPIKAKTATDCNTTEEVRQEKADDGCSCSVTTGGFFRQSITLALKSSGRWENFWKLWTRVRWQVVPIAT